MPSPSRMTAQAAYEVVSDPSSLQQVQALVLKNIRVRSRDIAQTVSAVFEPSWMMLILVLMRLSAKAAADHMSVIPLPYLSVGACTLPASECTYFAYTGLPSTDPILGEISTFFAASEPLSVVPTAFATEDAMNAAYEASPGSFVVGVVFLGPTTNLSGPMLSSSTVESEKTFFHYRIAVHHAALVSRDYVGSRFATAQAYVERAAINVRRKALGRTPLSSPLPLKTDPGSTNSGLGRTFISLASFVGTGTTNVSSSLNPFYIIFCFQSVWQGVLSLLVTEKKKKIRMGMTLMGMNRNAYLFSIWSMQTLQNMVTCILMVLILFLGQIFVHTNPILVLLLLILFSINATAFGSMASALIPDPKKTNQASMVILVLTVGSHGACSLLVFGGSQSVDPMIETILFLIPSVALGRALHHISVLEAVGSGLTLANLSSGPCVKVLGMLWLDIFLYCFLAWYLDAIFPGEFDDALPIGFLFRPSYWGWKKSRQQQQRSQQRRDSTHSLTTLEDSSVSSQSYQEDTVQETQDAEMFEVMDDSRLAEHDRGIIQVQGVHKTFSTKPGLFYRIPLLGWILGKISPPRAEQKTGPMAARQNQEVIAGLDLQVHRNEIVGFLGHNGAGKTTALSVIMGMVAPTVGQVVVHGQVMPRGKGDVDLVALREIQRKMGVCPQHDILFESLTAWETVQLYASIKGVHVKAYRGSTLKDGLAAEQLLHDYLMHLLEDVYLAEKRHERVSTFSGGMKRKLSVALAFLGDPKVVLLDEPTTGMDVFTRKQVWQLMQDSKIGRAILLTTHSMEEADALGDRIAILSRGKLQTMGSSLFLKNRFGLGYRLNLEKRRPMLSDPTHSRQSSQQHEQEASGNRVVFFDASAAEAIVLKHFPDAVVQEDSTADMTFMLPTTGTVEQRKGRSAKEYIQYKKAALPDLLEHLDREMAENRLGIKSVGLSLTTLEEVFVRLQEQELAERDAAKEGQDENHL